MLGLSVLCWHRCCLILSVRIPKSKERKKKNRTLKFAFTQTYDQDSFLRKVICTTVDIDALVTARNDANYHSLDTLSSLHDFRSAKYGTKSFI